MNNMRNVFEKIILPIQLAWKSLALHKGRSFLTILGIMIGIGAVIVVMSAGESIKDLILSEFESFGTDYIQVEVKVPSTGRNSADNASAIGQGVEITTFTNDDVDAIGVLPNIYKYGSCVMAQDLASYLDQNKVVNIMGCSTAIPDIMGFNIEYGRNYTDQEDDQLARVVVLGSKVAEELFGNTDPVGQRIKLGKFKYKVIGIVEPKGATFGLDFDNLVYTPLQTTQKLILGIDYVMFATLKVNNVDRIDETANNIVMTLRDRHDTDNEKEDDFAVTTAKEALEIINSVFDGITLLLVSIAAISLLVGGVGIMNIMYVSVTERTFEIGLRKAVGAKPSQIRWQFLWEAIVVTVFGGLIGIVLGISLALAVSFIAQQFGYDWEFILPPQSILLAFGFCAVVGLIFGYYPAQKAAQMDPITALGHE